MSFLYKVWNLGGVFYISLALSSVVYFSSRNKIRRIFTKSIVIIGLCFSLFYSLKANLFSLPNQITLSAWEKIDRDSINQHSFAQKAKQILPSDSSGCVLQSWDTPTAYLIQELYPLVFVPIEHFDKTSSCDYLITQFSPFPQLSQNLLLEFDNNYIYKPTP